MKQRAEHALQARTLREPLPLRCHRGEEAPLILAACLPTGRCPAGELETAALVTVVLGQDAKLPCFYRADPGEQVGQVAWLRVDAGAAARELALLHSEYGLHVSAAYEGRVERPPLPRSPQDGAVLLRNAVQADEGEYECRVSTFPAGSFEARLRLRVLGEWGRAGARAGLGQGPPAGPPARPRVRPPRRSLTPRDTPSAPSAHRSRAPMAGLAPSQSCRLLFAPGPASTLPLGAHPGPSPAVSFQLPACLPTACTGPSHVPVPPQHCRAEVHLRPHPAVLCSTLSLLVLLPETQLQGRPHSWA